MKNNRWKAAAWIAVLALAAPLSAGGKYVRLAWDSDPAHSAVVGFTPDSSSGAAYVLYGSSTDESTWKRADAGKLFDHNGFKSRFARLSNLHADTPVYFKVCDANGCSSDHYWFRTAPTESKPFVFVAGGDTRSGWTTRRAGNKLIADIRPLFIMHGGDYTNGNSGRDWIQYFKDWTHTYSSDTIDGTAYKRVYPIVPALGNHEGRDYSTLCNIFGVDYNQDGQCDEYDTYGAMNVTPLLRVYVLNTEFQYSGWSRQANAMNQWLKSDLTNEGPKAQWRVAEYHKPMFPHYSRKHENPTIYRWWAQLFYDKSVNLVVESDSHVFKITDILKPQHSSFVASRSGGTMYVGEGTWGASPRSADNAKRWTLDIDSIQQFKVVRVYTDKMEVRTAQFGGRTSPLSRQTRNQDQTTLPKGVKWRSVEGYGDALVLNQNAMGQSVLGKEDDVEEPVVEPKPEPKPKPKPDPVVKPKPKPKPVVEPEPDPEPVVKPKPKPQPVVEPEPDPEPVVTPKPKPQPQPEPVVEPEPDPEPVVAPESKPDTEETDETEPVLFDILDFNMGWDFDLTQWFDDFDFDNLFGSWK